MCMLSTSQSAALSNGLGITVKTGDLCIMELKFGCSPHIYTAEEPSPHRLRRIKTMDMPTGLQHQPVGMMTELTQKLARKRL